MDEQLEAWARDAGDDPLLALVGARIRAARRLKKLSQSDLARAIDSKQSYIVTVEAGQRNLTLKSLSRIAAALGVMPAMLLLEGEMTLAADGGKLDESKMLIRTAMNDAERAASLLQQLLALAAPEASSRKRKSPG